MASGTVAATMATVDVPLKRGGKAIVRKARRSEHNLLMRMSDVAGYGQQASLVLLGELAVRWGVVGLQDAKRADGTELVLAKSRMPQLGSVMDTEVYDELTESDHGAIAGAVVSGLAVSEDQSGNS